MASLLLASLPAARCSPRISLRKNATAAEIRMGIGMVRPLSWNTTPRTKFSSHALKNPNGSDDFKEIKLGIEVNDDDDDDDGFMLPNINSRIKGGVEVGMNVREEEDLVTGSTYPDLRLFSNVNQATLQHEPGSLWSAILLVAGTTVGAGILAIPAVTEEGGFSASVLTCFVCWFYMVTTGLLLAEVNVNTMCELGSGGVSLVSMAERTLGKTGLAISCITYIFIHYALLVAYVARSSSIMESLLHLSSAASALTFTLVLGGLCCFGSQKTIGEINGGLVVCVVVSFFVLVCFSSTSLDLSSLLKFNAGGIPKSIPVVTLSFVYQNVVPVICTNLEGDLPQIRNAILFGTSIPLLMFLVWNAVILGNPMTTLPPSAEDLSIAMSTANSPMEIASALDAVATAATSSPSTSLSSFDPLTRLRSTPGPLGLLVDLFSFFAIATSYIGFVLGLSDFLSDLLKLPSSGNNYSNNRFIPFFLTLFPPLFLSMLNPSLFFDALDLAGTYGVLVLFGIIPAAMSWKARSLTISSPQRYKESQAINIKDDSLPEFLNQNQRVYLIGGLVPGGKLMLFIVSSSALVVIFDQLLHDFNLFGL